jgi:hypothetical protein
MAEDSFFACSMLPQNTDCMCLISFSIQRTGTANRRHRLRKSTPQGDKNSKEVKKNPLD